MKIIHTRHFPPKGYSAIMLFGALFVRRTEDGRERILSETKFNHELIHCAQAKELLWVFFYVAYVIEFVVKLVAHGFRWNEAYYDVSFEREAYDNAANMDYLKTRGHYAQWTGNYPHAQG